MSRQTRRSCLALLGAVGTSLAGCAAGPDGTPTDDGTRAADRTPRTTTTGPTRTATTGPTRHLVLTRVDPPGAVTAATVYPRRLRSWLREAATTDAALRVRAEVPAYAPEPVLTAFDRVRLSSPDGAVDGVYDVAAEGGPYYEWRVGGDPVTDVPDDADVTAATDLPADRRSLVELALGDGGTLVAPQTELGSWVRHEFLGGYYSLDGTTYRGRKLAQTDAAFFGTEVWLVLSLSRVTGAAASAPTTLRLAAVPDPVRRVVDGLVGDDPGGGYLDRNWAELGAGDADAVERFARETRGLLFHAAAFEVGVAEAGLP